MNKSMNKITRNLLRLLPLLHPPRPVYLTLFILCAALLGFGYYLQFVQGLEPCPLCIMQRFAFMGILALSLLGFLHAPRKIGTRIYSGLAAACAAIGAMIAARQVWLQHLPPDQVPECGPGLYFMLQAYPLSETFTMLFKGTGECAQVHWLFLSMSIAEWSLIWFLLLLLALLLHTTRGTP